MAANKLGHMVGRIALSLLAFAALSSCSRIIEVRAEFRDGRLYFVGDDSKKTSYPWCLSSFRVVDTDGVTAWSFEVPLEVQEQKRECGPNLPIAYGVAPRDAVVDTPPRQLQHGKVYIVAGTGAGSYDGAFRYERQMILRRTVTNVEVDSTVRSHALGYDQNDLLEENSTPTETQ